MSGLILDFTEGEAKLTELRAEHGLEPRGYESGDPPSSEQMEEYFGSLEGFFVAAQSLRAQDSGRVLEPGGER